MRNLLLFLAILTFSLLNFSFKSTAQQNFSVEDSATHLLVQIKSLRTPQDIEAFCRNYWNSNSDRSLCTVMPWTLIGDLNFSILKVFKVDQVHGFLTLSNGNAYLVLTYSFESNNLKVDIDNPNIWQRYTQNWEYIKFPLRIYRNLSSEKTTRLQSFLTNAQDFVANQLNLPALTSLQFFFANDEAIENDLGDPGLYLNRFSGLSRQGFVLFSGDLLFKIEGHSFSEAYLQSVIAHEVTHEHINFNRGPFRFTVSLLDEGIATYIQYKYLFQFSTNVQSQRDHEMQAEILKNIEDAQVYLQKNGIFSLLEETQFRSNRGFYLVGAGTVSFLLEKVGLKKFKEIMNDLQNHPRSIGHAKIQIESITNEVELTKYIQTYLTTLHTKISQEVP